MPFSFYLSHLRALFGPPLVILNPPPLQLARWNPMLISRSSVTYFKLDVNIHYDIYIYIYIYDTHTHT